MACYKPIPAFQTIGGQVVFVERGDIVKSLWLPCGKCIGCRLERARQWGVRCMHEAQMHTSNCFITLTYDDLHVPEDGSLRYKDFQDFMKRLRKSYANKRIRFFACGEYGEKLGRPHFHAILFGHDFADKIYWKKGAKDSKLYRSAILEGLWPVGHSSVGSVTFDSACYVARYVLEKCDGLLAEAHYDGKVPEMCHMSTRPGLGAEWIKKYWTDVFPLGMTVLNGVEQRAPKYYMQKFKKADDDGFAALKMREEKFMGERVADSTPRRLADREAVAKARIAFQKRRG